MTSPALDDFHERVVLAAQSASPTVRLVGGTGLSLLLGHLVSKDLDLFCAPREDIGVVVRAVVASADAAGAVATPVRTGPGFQRLELGGVHGTMRVDVAADTAERLEPVPLLVGLVRAETLRDQRANKLIALLGRSKLRDLVDLFFIENAGCPAVELFVDAVAKDGGNGPGVVRVGARPNCDPPAPGSRGGAGPRRARALSRSASAGRPCARRSSAVTATRR